MMFNGLLMCTDSDSDFTKESIGRSSEVDSPSSSCASARAQYYHNKLLATLQILQNKEETVQVQAESLAVAEARIASLTARSVELRREIEWKGRELKTLRDEMQESRKEQCDVSIIADMQEIDNQKNIVTTLQNNLGVIEDLYRECFYETAKQEGLIEMLRKSYLDVRLLDREKSNQITRLHGVINTQKWTLDKCQDIASDVDNLKVEISNFLNSSNNDSGVWEESLAGDLTEDLQDIAGQLFRLRELLTRDCTCGLEEENRKLRDNNEAMEIQMDDLRRKLADFEIIVGSNTEDRQDTEQIRAKENEFHFIRQKLVAVDYDARDSGQTCEAMAQRLQQTQELLSEKTTELARLQKQCQQHEDTIGKLREELTQRKEISKDYCALRGTACAAQRKVRALQAQLAKAMQHCVHSDASHREEVKALEASLWEAQARGASLCEEARRATRSVRAWTRHSKDLHREQEEQIKQKQSQIRGLELRLEQGQNDTTLTRGSENDACKKCICARSISNSTSSKRNNKISKSHSFERNTRSEEPSCSKCPQIEGSFTSNSSKVQQRPKYLFETSASEMGSSSTPVAPERPSRTKRFNCVNRFCSEPREASVQRQRSERRDTATSSSDKSRPGWECLHNAGHARLDTVPRDVFEGSVADVMTRVEGARAALAGSLRRWRGHGTPPRAPRPSTQYTIT